jgi:hypothetical protein
VIGEAILYIVMCWAAAALQPTDGVRAADRVFLANLLFGLVMGVVLAVAFCCPSVAGALPASR